MYRNTTPATPAPKIQPSGRCGNINTVDQLRHPKSVAYSVELVLEIKIERYTNHRLAIVRLLIFLDVFIHSAL